MTIGNTRSTFLISRLVSSPRLRFVSVLSVLLSPLLILCYLRSDGDTCQRFGSPESSICRIVTSPFSTHRFSPPGSPIHSTTTFFSFFSISRIADGSHHYHPACGHKGSSHLSPVHALQLFYRDASSAFLQLVNQWLILLTHVPTLSVTKERTQILLW